MNGMRVQGLRSKWVAWWLLLLLGRVMAPEAAVLGLHAHHHTVDEPAQVGVAGQRDPRAVLSSKHTHCHSEQLYNAPALLAGAVAVPVPVRRAVFAGLSISAVVGQPRAARYGRPGRGPPRA